MKKSLAVFVSAGAFVMVIILAPHKASAQGVNIYVAPGYSHSATDTRVTDMATATVHTTITDTATIRATVTVIAIQATPTAMVHTGVATGDATGGAGISCSAPKLFRRSRFPRNLPGFC